MTWYTASIIQSIKYKDEEEVQDSIPVYENYVLIEAENTRDAFFKAESHAKEVSGIDDRLQLNGKPAYMCFEGIRKMIEVSEPLSVEEELEVKVLRTGVELSYSYMQLDSQEALNKLKNGRQVVVTYIDSDESE